MYKIASDFLYDDKTHLQMLAGIKKADDNGYIMKVLSNAVKSCIESGLTDKQKIYLTMYYFDSLNIPQIAKKMNVNKSTVSRTLAAARNKICRQLEFIAMQ